MEKCYHCEEALKHDTVEDFVEVVQKKELAKFNADELMSETLDEITTLRHEIHSEDEDIIFLGENSKLDDNIGRISEEIEELKITGNEKKIAKKLRTYAENIDRPSEFDREVEDFTDEEWDNYAFDAVSVIGREKEEINNIIEKYLGEVDKAWDKYNLDEVSQARRGKTFKPSGFLRNRDVFGDGKANPAENEYFEDEIDTLKTIYNKAHKQQTKPLNQVKHQDLEDTDNRHGKEE
jgi:hypothetical protein